MKQLKKILKFKRELKNDLISLYYAGKFSDQFTDLMIQLTQHEEHEDIKNNLSYLMVEVFQNIVRYKKDEKSKYEIFGLRSIEDNLHIFSSNVVDVSSYSLLKEKLQNINEKEPDDLKKLYLEILKAGVFGEKGGAGLGLLQMARRSSNPIQYDFSAINNDAKLFQYQLDFSINKGERILERDKIDIRDNITLFKEIHDEDIIFLFKGDFKKENANAILSIIQANTRFQTKNKEFNDYRVFHTAVELIQNISRHGKDVAGSVEGVFCLMKNENGFYLATGNYIKNGEFGKAEDHFNKLNNFEGDDLQKIYLKTLKENAITESNQAGVGLIDVRRYNQSQFDFDIITDDIGFYLTAGVLIPFYI
ncbi:MAG: hypothetical protein CL838_04175 [Crocinitomicaceae bacterium]|nr:hypothetical protein [Crocinitomicaceae bacterium]